MDINKQMLVEVMPKTMKSRVDDDVIAKIEAMCDDEGMAETIRENMISYTSVLSDGKFKMEAYLTAVKYATYKLIGDTNHTAFARTFPVKMATWKAEARPQKEIARYTTAYNQSKLVTLIMAQARMPVAILNADVYQQTINAMAEIALDMAVSPRDRVAAGNTLLTNLKPDVAKIELDVSIKTDSIIQGLRDVTMAYAAKQLTSIQDGVYNAGEIAHQSLVIEGDFSDAEE